MYRCQTRIRDRRYTRRCRLTANRLNSDGTKHCRRHAEPEAAELVYDDERELILVVLPNSKGVGGAR
jgi:hypothetical protein